MAVEDDPAHTLFECVAFEHERRNLNRILEKNVAPKDVDRIMCGEEALRWITNPTLRANA